MENIIFYILLALTVLLSAFYVYKSNGQTGVKPLILKAISSLMFTGLAIYACFINMFILGIFIFVLGFVASCFGDVILGLPDFPELKEKKNFLILAGGSFFAFAHIAYYIGMILLFGWAWWSLLIAIPFALFFFLFNKFVKKINYGKMNLGIAFYSLFISVVVCQGLYALFVLPFAMYSIILALGFLLFYASDVVLMRIYFGENQNNKVLYYYNLAFYYAAQILLAVSLFVFII